MNFEDYLIKINYCIKTFVEYMKTFIYMAQLKSRQFEFETENALEGNDNHRDDKIIVI